jgi:predicted Zn-dependent peptidase
MRAIVLSLLISMTLAGQIRMPAYQRVGLDNGATLFLMPKKDLPLVSVRVSVRGGAEADPAGMNGVGLIALEMLSRGTEKRSREKLAEDLDQLGVRVQTVMSRQTASIDLEFLSKDSAQVIALLEEMLLQPKFDEGELKQLISEKVDAVKVAKDQPQLALREYFASFYFGKAHPYGRAMNGDELSLPKLTRASVAEHWKRSFVGKNLIVVVAGDVEGKTAETQLKALFGKLPAGAAYVAKNAAAPSSAAPRLLLVDSPGATQTYFAIGQPGIDRVNPDRTKLELVNTLFGGRFTSMLNDALRVDSGLTYGVNSILQLDRLPGTISIVTFTKTESTEAAIDLALKQLEKLQSQGIDAEQLASAKAYVKGEYPTKALETINQLSGMLTDFEVFGLNRGEVDDLISRIDAATLEQVNQTARNYYKTSGLVFVLIGDAAKIRKTAEKYARDLRVVKISEPGF